MPRSRRSRKPRGRGGRDEEPRSLDHLIEGWRRTEVKRGIEYTVQPISAARAAKVYVCPACSNPIDVGVAHVVVWRADHLFGDDHAIGERRHWHSHCWRIP